MKLSACRRVGRPAALHSVVGEGGSPSRTAHLSKLVEGFIQSLPAQRGLDHAIMKIGPSVLEELTVVLFMASIVQKLYKQFIINQ